MTTRSEREMIKREQELAPQLAERVLKQSAYRPPLLEGAIRLQLDRNEGRGTLEQLEAAELFAATGSELARRYPQPAALQTDLAKRFGVEQDQVLVTAGGDDSLARVCQAFVDPGSEVILPSPTFEMIAKYTGLAGGTIREVAWGLSDFPVEEILGSVTSSTRVVAIVSPNNPTGSVVRPAALERLIRELPQVLLLVDLAYAEFATDDLTAVALAAPNAIIVRTFSKAWGLAGLRVGYALGAAHWIDALRRAGNPYPVCSLSVELARRALARPELAAAYVSHPRDEREELNRLLAEAGIETAPSEGNFVFARTPAAELIWRGFGARGIAVRWFGEQPALRDALRITCPGNPTEFVLLKQSLAEVLAEVIAASEIRRA